MTSIHAPIPPRLQDDVDEAKFRGEDRSLMTQKREDNIQFQRPRKLQRIQTGSTKKASSIPSPSERLPQPPRNPPRQPQPMSEDEHMSDSENDDPASASKENNPSLSPTPIRLAPPSSPRKNAFGKRPLSVLSLAYPEDLDRDMMMLVDSDSDTDNEAESASPTTNVHISPSEQNISANTPMRSRMSISPQRKTPKLAPSRTANAPTRLREDVQIYEDVPDRTLTDFSRRFGSDGKENQDSGTGACILKERRELHAGKAAQAAGAVQTDHGQIPVKSLDSSDPSHSSSRISKKIGGVLRKAAAPKMKARIGVRRL